ncbi:MAG: hypothetical protein ACQER7_13850, partial [Bacteroidota bacterium]
MSKKGQNKANEPLSDYGEPVSFNQVWEMFRETDKQFKETDKKFQETDKRMQETDRKIERLAKLYGGVSENSKDVAEEF